MLRAHGSKVIVWPDEAPIKTSSGLFLPVSAIATKCTGLVQSVGSKVTSVTVGDRVAFEDNAGHRIQDNGITLIVLGIDEILGRQAA